MKKILTLQNLRRAYGVFFFLLFVLLIGITDFRHIKGYEVSLFLELDPLVALLAFLTSWTVYKGLALSLATIIGTLLLGRFFCSWICPMGILNQWISHLFNKRRPAEDYSVNAYRKVYRLKYYILVILVALALFGSLQIGLLDPIATITRSFVVSVVPALNHVDGALYLRQPFFYGGIAVTFLFLAVLFANRFLTRFWCRVLSHEAAWPCVADRLFSVASAQHVSTGDPAESAAGSACCTADNQSRSVAGICA